MFKGAFMRHLGYLRRAEFGLSTTQKQMCVLLPSGILAAVETYGCVYR